MFSLRACARSLTSKWERKASKWLLRMWPGMFTCMPSLTSIYPPTSSSLSSTFRTCKCKTSSRVRSPSQSGKTFTSRTGRWRTRSGMCSTVSSSRANSETPLIGPLSSISATLSKIQRLRMRCLRKALNIWLTQKCTNSNNSNRWWDVNIKTWHMLVEEWWEKWLAPKTKPQLNFLVKMCTLNSKVSWRLLPCKRWTWHLPPHPMIKQHSRSLAIYRNSASWCWSLSIRIQSRREQSTSTLVLLLSVTYASFN